jgi:hypothetical protein
VGSGVASRLGQRGLRYLRRQRWTAPLLAEWDRWRLLRTLRRRGLRGQRLLIPSDLAADVGTPVPYPHTFATGADLALDGAVVQVDALQLIALGALRTVRQRMTCTYLGGRYALFERAGVPVEGAAVLNLLARVDDVLTGQPAHRPAQYRPPGDDPARLRRAILVTTYRRPAALERSLPQIAALGPPVLVVDDGSPAEIAAANRTICGAAGATYLALPRNYGLPVATNVGLSVLMAEPTVRWISYFQDDADVRPDALEQLLRVEDAAARPILTGYDAPEHPAVDEVEIGGLVVKRKRSSRALHLHAHVEYWAGVMPIPSTYLGTPKPAAGGSLEDWWILNHAPRSAEQRGLFLICVPGLVRTFLWRREDSTWDNANPADPPLSV